MFLGNQFNVKGDFPPPKKKSFQFYVIIANRFYRRKIMARKRYRSEDIISKLREADIHISQGNAVAETIRRLGITLNQNHRNPEAAGLDEFASSGGHGGIQLPRSRGLRLDYCEVAPCRNGARAVRNA